MNPNATKTMSPHKMEACKKLSPMGQRLFRYVEFDDEEQLLAEIRKDPVGLFFIFLTGFFITTVIIIATSMLSLNVNAASLGTLQDGGTSQALILFVGLLLAGISLFMTFVMAIIYKSNVVFITDQKIAEVMYASILNRRVMQLGIGNVEDVSVTQKGILPRIFNYGSLVIETAGEIANPAFTYVPNPYDNSQIIIQAHEEYVRKYGN